MRGRALVCPGVAGVESAGTDSVSAAAAYGFAGAVADGASTGSAAGRAENAADRAPAGLSGGVFEKGSISAEWDVLRHDPVVN